MALKTNNKSVSNIELVIFKSIISTSKSEISRSQTVISNSGEISEKDTGNL